MYINGKTYLKMKSSDIMEEEKIVAVLTTKEIAEGELPYIVNPAQIPENHGAHFCKAETHLGYICGTFCVPIMDFQHQRRASFSYVLRQDLLLFKDDSGAAASYVQQVIENHVGHNIGLGRFFCEFIEELTSKDLIYLEDLEKRILKLENVALSGMLAQFNQRLMALRKELMAFSHYYTQLEALTGELQENENGFFDAAEEHGFKLLASRLSRVHGEIQMLREYSMQVREVYQAQIDIHQNKIMRILTVVTTIFMPLTLLAGWYGMNFVYMPELSWKYGYLAMILVSWAIVALSIWLFKKKKFW